MTSLMLSALTPKRSSASTGLSVELAAPQLRFFGVEAGIDQDFAAAAPDQPDEIVEILTRSVSCGSGMR